MGQKAIDLSGEKFDAWTVIERGKTKGTHVYWKCICQCGTNREVTSDRLRNGHSKSCGCLSSQLKTKSLTKHGMTKSPEYKAWIDMRRRCNNPSSNQHKYYGGRGITVCDRWNDFKNFLSDMGERPSDKYTLERIDVNGNYDPSNCRWATWLEQSHNRRPRGNSDYNGVRWNRASSRWRSDIRVKGKRIHLGTFKEKKDAINARKQAEQKYWESS